MLIETVTNKRYPKYVDKKHTCVIADRCCISVGVQHTEEMKMEKIGNHIDKR